MQALPVTPPRPIETPLPGEIRQRERAGMLLQMELDRRHLPDFLPGEPSRLAASTTAAELAPGFIEKLARLYRVRRWGRDAFMRAYVRGALEGWRPGQRVEERPDLIRVVSYSCPLAAEAELDPRACQMCRAFHGEVAQRTMGSDVRDVRFDRILTRGDATCTMTVSLREAP